MGSASPFSSVHNTEDQFEPADVVCKPSDRISVPQLPAAIAAVCPLKALIYSARALTSWASNIKISKHGFLVCKYSY